MTDIKSMREARRKRRGQPPQAADQPAPINRATFDLSCVHRGEETRRLACTSCAGHVQQRIYKCEHPAEPDECLVELKKNQATPGLGVCAGCIHRSSQHRQARMSWAVGITAAKRPGQPTLAKTVEHLAAAGWHSPTIFADGADFQLPGGCPQVVRADPIGALSNFYAACAEMLVRFPAADAHVLVQDDCTFAVGVRDYLERCGWPKDAGLLKLFTDKSCDGKANGWHKIPYQWQMRGAQAYLFSAGYLERFLASRQTIQQRRGTNRPNNGIDNVVARWAREDGITQYCHTPSFSQHEGTNNSTLGHSFPKSVSYPGDSFDFRNLAPQPCVVAAMITQPGREQLAAVAIKSFKNQSYAKGRRYLLILTSDQQTTLTSDQSHRIQVRQVADLSLGELRNHAIEWAQEIGADAVIQWDDDDYSTPDRMARQVEQWKPGQAVVLSRQLRLNLNGTEAGCVERNGGVGIEGTILHDAKTPYRYPHQGKAEDTVFAKEWQAAKLLRVIDNDPRLYCRLYHGKNTWNQAHVLPVGMRQLAGPEIDLVQTVRRQYPSTPRARWLQQLAGIDGWADAAFCRWLVELADWQNAQGITGPLAEIGLHHGRTFTGLAVAAEEHGDQAIGVDPFGGPAYEPGDKRRQTFLTHMGRICPDAPVRLIERASQELRVAEFPAPARLWHVDGAHEYDAVRCDMLLATATTADMAVILFDDFANTRWPEVGQAFWQNYRECELVPFAVAWTRICCATCEQDAAVYRAWCEQHPAATKRIEGPQTNLVLLGK